MSVKVAINGFGRIGRLVLRAIIEEGRTDLIPVRINASTSMNMDSLAHLFAYDSAHGRFVGQVEVEGNNLTLRHNGRTWGPIPVTFERDPSKLDLRGIDVDIPLGRFTCVTGVSGSGKSSLVIDTLHAALAKKLHGAVVDVGHYLAIWARGSDGKLYIAYNMLSSDRP